MNQSTKQLVSRNLLIISFVEGAAVMVAELAGGKMLAPFYGTSLFVWASTLAVTLGALTVGYYLGGQCSRQADPGPRQWLLRILLLAACLVMIMPLWANTVMKFTLDLSFLTGLVLSQLAFLFPPILCMGVVSPLIINELSRGDNSGKSAGMVYAVSTLGGVIATLLTGFWLVPLIGISIPCIVIGALLLVVTLVVLGWKRHKLAGLLLLLLAPGIGFVMQARNSMSSDKYDVTYYSEGMLGQMKVIEFPTRVNGRHVKSRALLVNHNWQTWVDSEHPDLSLLHYTRFTKAMIRPLRPGQRVLLIGLGGGTVARQIEQQPGVAFDIVEIDGRLPRIAGDYFGFRSPGRVAVDDGRHFINVAKERYDLVIIDALLGENVPSQLLSLECFRHIQSVLAPEGRIFIEFDGIGEDEDGLAQKMVANTIRKAGYRLQVYTSVPGNQATDIMYLATMGSLDAAKTITVDSTPYLRPGGPLGSFETNLTNASLAVLTDDKPALDYLLRDKMVTFRQEVLRSLNKEFLEDEMFFYY